MQKTPRMRTLPEAVREIKRVDPDSALTLTALRRMVRVGQITCINIASKKLICLDVLLEMLGKSQETNVNFKKHGGKNEIY